MTGLVLLADWMEAAAVVVLFGWMQGLLYILLVGALCGHGLVGAVLVGTVAGWPTLGGRND